MYKVGLYFFDPDMNLMRDPRWGRAQEVPGECPYLTGEVCAHRITRSKGRRASRGRSRGRGRESRGRGSRRVGDEEKRGVLLPLLARLPLLQ